MIFNKVTGEGATPLHFSCNFLAKAALYTVCGIVAGGSIAIAMLPPAIAQPIIPAADGVGTVVNQAGNRFEITGGTLSEDGANLFHSLEAFGLSVDQIAEFIANPGIQNILSRVTGGDASIVDGLLQVTGSDANLLLMNPAGVIFGPNAQLNLPAAFTATTATGIGFGDQWFNAAGDNSYESLVGTPDAFIFGLDQPGAILNLGDLALEANQSLMLAGGTVINLGTLSTPGGEVTIAAIPGQNVVRISHENRLLSLDLEIIDTATEPTPQLPASFSPLSIPALLTGGAVTHATEIVTEADGSVRLTTADTVVPTEPGVAIAAGTLDVSGSQGGDVAVLGDRVGLVDARVDASGQTGGGTVRIGGGYQGQGTVPNATVTYVGPEVAIDASALLTGDGGRAIVWANDTTRFLGAASARGGQVAGNGGLVEISGLESLTFDGEIDVGAPFGENGTILFDPANIAIVAGTGANDDELSDGQILFTDGGNADFQIGSDTLNSLPGNIVLQATNDIEARSTSEVVDITAQGDITLEAGNNITIFLYDFTSSQGNINFLANDTLSIGRSEIQTNGDGQINLSAGNSLGIGNLFRDNLIQTENGSINLMGGLGDDPAIPQFGKGINLADRLTISSQGGDITLMGRGGDSSDGIGVDLNSGASIESVTGDITLIGDGGTSGDTPGIAMGFAGSTISSIDGNITLQGTAGINPNPTDNDGSAGIIILGDGVVETSGIGNINLDGKGGNVSIRRAGGVIIEGAVNSTGSGDIAISGVGGSASNDGNTTGVSIQDTGEISSTGSGNTTIQGKAGSGANNQGVIISGTLELTGTGGISIESQAENDNNILETGIFTMPAGSLINTNGNDLTLTAADIELQGDALIDVGSGNITFQPLDPASNIGIGDANNIGGFTADFNLDSTELTDNIESSGTVTIGSIGGTGEVRIRDLSSMSVSAASSLVDEEYNLTVRGGDIFFVPIDNTTNRETLQLADNRTAQFISTGTIQEGGFTDIRIDGTDSAVLLDAATGVLGNGLDGLEVGAARVAARTRDSGNVEITFTSQGLVTNQSTVVTSVGNVDGITAAGNGDISITSLPETGEIIVEQPIEANGSGEVFIRGIANNDSNVIIRSSTTNNLSDIRTEQGSINLETNSGILLDGVDVLSEDSGDVILNADFDNDGVGLINIFDTNIDTNGGNFSAIGRLGDEVESIDVTSSTIRTGAGDISLDGDRSLGTDSSTMSTRGIVVRGGSILETTTGSISLTGVGGSVTDIDSHHGVIINSSSQVTTTEGNIEISGTGGNGRNNSHGVVIQDPDTLIGSSLGNISITAIGGEDANGSSGGLVLFAGQLEAENGTIAFDGQGNTATNMLDSLGIGIGPGSTISFQDIELSSMGVRLGNFESDSDMPTEGISFIGESITFENQVEVRFDIEELDFDGSVVFNAPINSISDQDLFINSTREIDINADLVSKSNVFLTATESITTSDISTASSDGRGADIFMSSPGPIATGNLTSTGPIAGGDITVESGTSITTGAIDASSTQGDGGDVTLDPPGDVQVVSINAQGGTEGSGGEVFVFTGQFFRATDSFIDQNGVEASISTAGGIGSGSITIFHDGGSRGIPFIVGDASTNGTAEAITSGEDNTILPTQSFLSSYFQGNISLITANASDIILEQSLLAVPAAPLSPVAEQLVLQAEESFTREYENYFGRTGETEIKSLVQIQNELRQIQHQTARVRPALIYSFFFSPDVDVDALAERIEQYGQDIATAVDQAAESRQADADEFGKQWGYSSYIPADRAAPENFNVRDYIAAAGDEEAQLVVLMVTSQGQPVLRGTGVNRRGFRHEASFFTSAIRDRGRVRGDQLYQWLIGPLEAELQARRIDNLVFISAAQVRSLPYAAVDPLDSSQTDHSGDYPAIAHADGFADAGWIPVAALQNSAGDYLIEQYSLGLMPSMSLTDTRYSDIRYAPAVALGISEHEEADLSDLPYAELEVDRIIDLRPGSEPLDAEAATLDALQAAIAQHRPQIVHLSTHASFSTGTPEDSYIQLEERVSLNEFRDTFQETVNTSIIELLVLGACQTTLGHQNFELGFAGIAYQAGVKSVIASLNRVPDVGTFVLMSHFYDALSNPVRREDLGVATATAAPSAAPTGTPSQIHPEISRDEYDRVSLHFPNGESVLLENYQPIIKAEALQRAQQRMIDYRQDASSARGLLTIPGLDEADLSTEDQAQLEAIDFQDLSYPKHWAWFTIVGNPW